MTDVLMTIWQRIGTLPRAIQWSVWAAIGIGVFVLWDGTLRPLSDEWALRGDDIEADVIQVRSGAQLADALERRDLAEAVIGIGPLDKPGSAMEGAAALSKLVNDVLARHTVKEPDFGLRADRRLPRETLRGVMNGKRLEAIKGDLNFIASTEETISILAALESDPNVEAVRSVRLTKEGNDLLKVRLQLEAWVISDSDGRAR
ncbi:MAG: hypothetical protein ACYTGR_14245 [Planctomycetota bacterium]|jgi:hypothetical protein